MRLGPADRLCIPVPLYHCFGMVLDSLTAAAHGATSVLPSESFDAESVLTAIAAERCTVLHGVPTMFIAELEHPRARSLDLSSLRTGIVGGAPCPISVMRRVIDEMHLRDITICYGMTETSPVSFQTHMEDSVENRVSSVGQIHPHVQAKITDADGRVVRLGTAGEILVRGYNIMKGYWGDGERTVEAVDGSGWMHTGDMGVLNPEGRCSIVGRVKDTIIRGGESVYPREIDEFLFRYPKVQEAVVVGVADPKYGEEICAVLRLRQGSTANSDEIREFCKEQIAHYKIPKHVHFVTEFPMTVTGKVQRFLLKDQVEAQLQSARTRARSG
jgi:fatty-acyl-CoA synthase